MDNLLIILYVFLGYLANQYLRRTLLGQVGVIYTSAGYYYLKQIIFATFLGFITIPLALIVFLFRTLTGSGK